MKRGILRSTVLLAFVVVTGYVLADQLSERESGPEHTSSLARPALAKSAAEERILRVLDDLDRHQPKL